MGDLEALIKKYLAVTSVCEHVRAFRRVVEAHFVVEIGALVWRFGMHFVGPYFLTQVEVCTPSCSEIQWF